MEEYKPNSFKSKEEIKLQQEKKKIEPIITTGVKLKKKSAWQTFKDQFINEDKDKVTSYILLDIIVPSVKKTISDIITNGIDILLFGSAKRPSGSSFGQIARTSYGSYWDQNQRNSRPYQPPNRQQQAYSHTFDDIIIPKYDRDGSLIPDAREKAYRVLADMDTYIGQYGCATIADLYELVGLPTSWADYKYGWTDLRSGDVAQMKDGYLLKLPKPMPID